MYKIVYILAAVAICCANAIGFPNENQMSRITGGSTASQAQFPYVISLQQLSFLPNHTLAHRCGGAMITYQHALTAAQCTYTVDVNMIMVPIVASQYRVFAGDVLLSGDSIAERVRTIANYTMHPEHLIYPALLNDIAVLTLTTPYLNTTVVLIPMATNNIVPDDFTLCSIAGWGALNTTSAASNALRYATKFTYNQPLCTQLYNSLSGVMNIHPNMICAASYDIYSVGCTGDEGNALVCNGQLAGILSLTNRCLTTSYPEVYAQVSNYTTWIRSVTGGAATFKPELGLFALAAIICAKIFS